MYYILVDDSLSCSLGFGDSQSKLWISAGEPALKKGKTVLTVGKRHSFLRVIRGDLYRLSGKELNYHKTPNGESGYELLQSDSFLFST